MEIKIFRPSDLILQNYIEFFYTLTRNSTEGPTTYLTFPTVNSILSVCKNATLEQMDNKLCVKHSPENLILSILAVNYKNPLLIEYFGQTNEISICFKPFALASFLDNPLNNYTANGNVITNFIPFNDFHAMMAELIEIEEEEERIDKLETYWVGKLKEHSHPFLTQVLQDLMLPNHIELSMAEIAERNNISHKTLIQHFEKHIGKKPSDFRKIARFRYAIQQKLPEIDKNNLTDLTYLAGYFDQSHMIKDFKALTGYSPKEFFKRLESNHDGRLNWIFTGQG